MKIGMIGLGLIGGSIAKGIKRIHPDWYIVAYNRTIASLHSAKADGAIDEMVDVIDSRVADVDVLYFCTPVETAIAKMKEVIPFLGPETILTDVGSTKATIYEAVKELKLSDKFVGGHPMAGSEKSGYSAAKAHLFENAYYVLTPGEGVEQSKIDIMVDIAKDLHAITVVMSPYEHDESVAAISHFPHLMACALVNQVRKEDESGMRKTLAAGGFKDITRIASSSPEMWEQICLTNQKPIAGFIRRFISELEQILSDVESGNGKGIYDLFETAGAYRNSITDQREGVISKSYFLYCDIVDRSGAIAEIAVLLATRSISIKNIGIIHNRGNAPGALRIDFDNEENKERAADVLKSYGFLAE